MCEFCFYLLVFFLKFSYVGRWNLFVEGCLTTTPNSHPQFCWKGMDHGSLHFQACSFPPLPLMLGFQDIYGSSACVAVYSAWCAEQWVCPVCFLTHTPYSFYCCFAQDGIAGRSAQKLPFFKGQAQVESLNCLVVETSKPDVFCRGGAGSSTCFDTYGN